MIRSQPFLETASESFFALSERAGAYTSWELPVSPSDGWRISATIQLGLLTEKRLWWLRKALYSLQPDQPRASSGLLRSRTATDIYSPKVTHCNTTGNAHSHRTPMSTSA